jgi:hypothetical protein
MLVVERILGRDDGRAASGRAVPIGVLVYACGLALAVAVAWPASAHRGSGVGEIDGARLAAAAAWSVAAPARWAEPITALPLPSLWVWAYFAYLIPRPAVLAFTAVSLVGLQMLFNVIVHLHAPWHVGSMVLVLVASAWLDASRSGPAYAVPLPRARVWLGRVLAAGMMLMLVEQGWMAWQQIAADVRDDYSENRRLAALIAGKPALAGAVVMGEPDTPPTSLPYYADNPIYLPREQAYRGWGVYAPPRAVEYDLAALLATARRLRAETGRPVIVTLGWDIRRPGRHTSFEGTRFEEHFAVTQEARDEFLAAVRPLARLRGPTLTDENYDVYVLP